MKEINPQSPVLVTGASGYVASWVVKELLEKGHTVHATVRNLSNKQRFEHLLRLEDQTPGTLKMFEADLMQLGSFQEAMKGCELVIHTASPFFLKVKDAQKQLIDPALKGTRNVLQSANETSSVKRIVLTSSVAAVYGDAADIQEIPGGAANEENWNHSSSLTHQPYSYSKTLAEKEAWKMVGEQDQWDLVVINPGFIMGPSLTKRTDSISIDFMRSMGSGKFRMGLPHLCFGIVDVRDVAKAHLQAGFLPQASGRHITVAESMATLEMASLLGKTFGDKYSLPKSYLPKFLIYLFGPLQGFTWKYVKRNVGYSLNFDNSYSKKDLQMEYLPVEQTLVEHLRQLERDGLL
ncbi:SDR family oxidoreductase [Xanthovirga aplysinae]|uniref:SDR family oxidoreductase n=1 Tax=Xanthovirga aplysinae TaxID=2529853 RepID=UPI0012BBBBE7|nr:aldehyde reductase [Xanthovirga aplysinae]MTI32064.1 aldehyde reductase [Xanthovirga aplysinae]